MSSPDPERIVVEPEELRSAIRRAAMRVPTHRIAEEVTRELAVGRPVDEVQPTAEDRALAERVLLRRGRRR